jgi:hypothetical protein
MLWNDLPLVAVLEDERSASEFQGQHVKMPQFLDHLMDDTSAVGCQVLVPEYERFVESVWLVLWAAQLLLVLLIETPQVSPLPPVPEYERFGEVVG